MIKRITERVSPRIFRVLALPAPTERERSQLYQQRYIANFPAAGEIALFDRSWYNRAGVERVMNLCTEEQYRGFLLRCPQFEKSLVDEGFRVFKYWFDIVDEEQERRMQARITDPRKIWKLSPMDLKSRRHWYDYSRARDDMFAATDTSFAPWHIVMADDKKRARLNCISHLLNQIPYKEVPREEVHIYPIPIPKGRLTTGPPWRVAASYQIDSNGRSRKSWMAAGNFLALSPLNEWC